MLKICTFSGANTVSVIGIYVNIRYAAAKENTAEISFPAIYGRIVSPHGLITELT